MATNSGHSHPCQAHSRLSKRDRSSGPPISAEPAHNNRVKAAPRNSDPDLRDAGNSNLATVHNTHLPQFVSPIPEPRALAIDALSQDWQGRSMFMFPPFPLLSKVIQKLRTSQEGEVILAPWWPSQPWFPHLLRLCVDHPLFFLYSRDLLTQQGYVSGKSYCLHAWRLSCNSTKQQDFRGGL